MRLISVTCLLLVLPFVIPQTVKASDSRGTMPPAGRAFAQGDTIWYQPDQSSLPRPIFTDTSFTPIRIFFRGVILVKGAFRDTSYLQFKQHKEERINCMVLDTTGQVLFLIQDCQNGELSPDGRQVAFGSYGEDIWPRQKDGIDTSPELYSHDLLTGKRLDITPKFREVIQQGKAAGTLATRLSFGYIRWTQFDGRIYTRLWYVLNDGYHGYGIFGYDPESGKAFSTNYKDLEFSPDGQYVFCPSAEGDPAQLFERESGREIPLEDPGNNRTFYLGEWVQNADRTMIYSPDGHLNYWLIDCGTGEVLQLPPRSSSAAGPQGLATVLCETHSLFYSPGGGASLRKIYSCTEGSIQRAALAPSADRVAILVHAKPEDNKKRHSSPMLDNTLVVLDTTGRELARLDSVLDFAWSPQGERLVAILQRPERNRSIGFCIVLLDCASGDTAWLASGSPQNSFRSIAWPAFSGKILASAFMGGLNGFVRYQFDPKTGASRVVADSRDIPVDRLSRGRQNLHLFATEFSPDGKYFFYEGKYKDGYRLGLVEDGQTVQVRFPGYAEIPNLYLVGWDGTGDRVLLYACTVQAFRSQIWEIDCASGAAQELIHPDQPMAWPIGVAGGKIFWAYKNSSDRYNLITLEIDN